VAKNTQLSFSILNNQRPPAVPIGPINKPSVYVSIAGILTIGGMILSSSADNTYFLVFVVAVAVFAPIVGVASTRSQSRTWVHWGGWMIYSLVIAPFTVGLFHGFFLYMATPYPVGIMETRSTGLYEWAGASFGVVVCLYPAFRRSWLIRDVPAGDFAWRPVLVFPAFILVSSMVVGYIVNREVDRPTSWPSSELTGGNEVLEQLSKADKQIVEYGDSIRDWNRISQVMMNDYLDSSISGELFVEKHTATLDELKEVVDDLTDKARAVSFDPEIRRLLIEITQLRAHKLRLSEMMFVCIREGDIEGEQRVGELYEEVGNRELALSLKFMTIAKKRGL
jgi:hypothetical protein